MHGSIRVLVALTLLAGIGASPALAQRNKLDGELRRLTQTRSGTSKVDVIVKVRPDSLARVAQKVRRQGGRLKAAHPTVGAFAAQVDRERLGALAADPDVEQLSVDAIVSALAGGTGVTKTRSETTKTGKGSKAGKKDLLMSSLRSTLGLDGLSYTGSGIGIALIDSGLQHSADFDVRVTAFRDFTKDDSADGLAVMPYDDFGHGTHIAGLIASNGHSTNGEFRGVAPTARLIGLKVLDAEGRGTTSDVIAAIEFAIRNKRVLGIDIINLSLGHPIYESAATDPLVQAVEKATRAGLIVIAAAGNYGMNPETLQVGYAGITSPGNAPSAITVAALKTKGSVDRADDRIPAYSSRGPTWYDALVKPDVVAPGDRLVSNLAKNSWFAKKYPELVTYSATNLPFLRLSGTSMSAGVTSGVVALMLEAQRASQSSTLWGQLTSSFTREAARVSANTAKALLQYTSLTVTGDAGEYDALTQGAGSVNAEGATRLASRLDVTAPIGTRWLTDYGMPESTIAGAVFPWSQTVYWGGREINGPAITVSELAWTEHVVWGTNSFWSTIEDLEHIVWGTGIVWDLLNVDEHIVWGTGLSLEFSFLGDEHIVWGSGLLWDEHIVWGTALVGYFFDEHIVWGTAADTAEATAWSNLLDLEHIVWGTGGVSAAGVK